MQQLPQPQEPGKGVNGDLMPSKKSRPKKTGSRTQSNNNTFDPNKYMLKLPKSKKVKLARLKSLEGNLLEAHHLALSARNYAENRFPSHYARAQVWLARIIVSDPESFQEDPIPLYHSAVSVALSSSFYLLREVLSMIKENLTDLRKKDIELAIDLLDRIRDWSLDELKANAAQLKKSAETIEELENWFNGLAQFLSKPSCL